jgi:HTH-type transcriptional regulator, repressor for puuD
MAEPVVLHFDEIKTVDRGNGVSTKPLAGSWIGTESFTSGVTSFPPRAHMRVHFHNVEETVTLLEGEAVAEIDGKSFPIKPLDTTYIPAGIAHRFLSTTDGPMRILWTYATTNVTRTFPDTGETVEHLSGEDKPGLR